MDIATMKDLILNNYQTILFSVFALGGLSLMGKQKIKNIVVSIMLQAEKNLAETGATKREYVINTSYELIPPVLKLFVSKAVLGVIVDGVIEYIKEDYDKRSK